MVLLGSGEKVLVESDALHYTQDNKASGAEKGKLTLTNQRLVFEITRGLIRKSTRTRVNLPLPLVSNVTADKPWIGAERLKIEGPVVHVFTGVGAHTWRDAIARARAAGPSYPGAAYPVGPVVVNVRAAEAPTPTVRIMRRCAYCQQVYPELDGKCPHCGAQF